MNKDLHWLAFRGPRGQIGPEYASSDACLGSPVALSAHLQRIAEERRQLVRAQVKLETARRAHLQRVNAEPENPNAFDLIGLSWHDDQIAEISRRMRALDRRERELLEGAVSAGSSAAQGLMPRP